MHVPCRYDEFGRIRRKNRGGEDRRSREEAALARLRGMPVQPLCDITQGCYFTTVVWDVSAQTSIAYMYIHVLHVCDIDSLLCFPA